MENISNKKIRIEEELEHRILRGLAHEWMAAVELLDPRHKKKMRLPLFELGAMKTRLGFWSSEKRLICLSRQFVLDHPWEAVREVLRHEIAHQFNDQVFGTRNETDHGPKFKEACFHLRVDTRASKHFKNLNQQLADKPGNRFDRWRHRVQKLLALAESDNQHEAESAMLKAHQLMAKYNMERVYHPGEERNFQSAFVGRPALRHRRDEYHLAGLLQDYYFVQGIWVSVYVLEKGKIGRVLEISGTPSNIDMAAYVYDFVNRFIETEWRQYNREKKLTLHRRTDFAIGIIEGFRAKLDSFETETENSADRSSYPVLREDAGLKAYMAYKYPYTRSTTRQTAYPHQGLYSDGVRIGKQLVIYKGVTRKETRTALLPPILQDGLGDAKI
jgi:hypothetical protein